MIGTRSPFPTFVLGLVWALASAPRAAAAAPAPAPPSAAELGRRIDAYAKPFVDAGHLSGQLLVARGGTILVERCWGKANLELGAPMTPETRLNIASVTKPMTVLLAFRLMEQRKIGYRDSIARWLPDFPEADRITIEHLLRHRSGIPHEIVPDSEATRPRTAEEMVERAKRRPLDFPPGSRYAYSTGGFTVLARILEIASGKDYGALLAEHLFGPLGMSHSAQANSVELLPGRAACYVPGANGIENATFQDLSGLVGGGSVWSTARDLHRFVQAIVAGRLGPAAYGSWVRGGRLDLNGRTSGFRAFADWDSATALEVTYLGNVSTGAADLLRDAVKKLAAGERVPPAVVPRPAEAPLAADRLARVTGAYQLETGTRLDVHVRDGRLWANDWVLLPAADGTFFSPRDYGIVRPVEGADGRVERLDWNYRGTVYAAPRIAEAPPPGR